jgi:hypothetical protein
LTFWDFILINDKEVSGVTSDDAVMLAHYAQLQPGTIAFNDFITEAMQ